MYILIDSCAVIGCSCCKSGVLPVPTHFRKKNPKHQPIADSRYVLGLWMGDPHDLFISLTLNYYPERPVHPKSYVYPKPRSSMEGNSSFQAFEQGVVLSGLDYNVNACTFIKKDILYVYIYRDV